MGTVQRIAFAAGWIAGISVAGALAGAASALAATCPENPDALGTSRTLVVSPEDYQRLGTMQYRHTLPLADHEVVITFDDGPLPPWSDKVLEILKSQCVKATFFIIGEMAQQFPDVVRREYAAGETVALHSQTHPLHFERLTGDKLDYQIDGAVASVSTALGDRDDLAPFFRIPGLGRSEAVEDALAARSLVVFSADVVADDWFHHITAAQIVQRAMRRLERRGGGILLLHDIHPWTVAALPLLLQQLKEHGFHVVQVVPPAPNGLLIAGGPKAWARAAAMPQAALIDRGGASPVWPQPNIALASAGDGALPAPDAAELGVGAPLREEPDAVDEARSTGPWPKLSELPLPASVADLAAPGLRDIGVSLRGEELVGHQIAEQPPARPRAARERDNWRKHRSLAAHRSRIERRRVVHARLHVRQRARRVGTGLDRHRA